jgi:hypothetical protein
MQNSNHSVQQFVLIPLIRGKHLHDRIISLRGEVWAHKTSLTPPLFIEVSVLRHVMHLCVRIIDCLFL